ncbi:hypothetical protein DFP72DRAFT_870094 [Ephemerocybe angulata]|uniref:Neuroguidin n=1 Tax=Ephemerocybe angulata TaxID=980116 RepID=A0A8H6ME06_9AGAR|nr:hypothetical protein DFP72DRAFT_870094 [Tulosesus angulatus]
MTEAVSNDATELQALLQTMTSSITASRASLKSFMEDPQSLDFADGISLLSLKHNVLISYLRTLALLSARRALGHSLEDRKQPTLPFSDVDRDVRGDEAGDLVDSMIEGRVILEKADALEGRMRYQIEKLLKTAEQAADADLVTNDPLAFKPNPQNLVDNGDDDGSDQDDDKSRNANGDAIYRPPHLAPVPYIEKSSKGRRERPPIPSALATLQQDPSRPHVESSTGLGGMPSLASGRAKHLKRITEYEEENFTRLMMKKTDAKRRARDEEDLALGGDLADNGPGNRRRRAGGLEDEFGDIFRSVHRVNQPGQGDGYDELRKKGKKQDILSRSRDDVVGRKRDNVPESDGEEGGGRYMRKRTRFDLEAKSAKKKLLKRKK